MATQCVIVSSASSSLVLSLRTDRAEKKQPREPQAPCQCQSIISTTVPLRHPNRETDVISGFTRVKLQSGSACIFCKLIRHRLLRLPNLSTASSTNLVPTAYVYYDRSSNRVLVRDINGRKCDALRLVCRLARVGWYI